MDFICDSDVNWEGWLLSQCHCDWLIIITTLCAMYITIIMIAYLRWTQDRGKNLSSPGQFWGHNLRGITSILLFLIFLLELAESLLSAPSSSTLTVPSCALGFWAAALVLAQVLEKCAKPHLLPVTSSLWALTGFLRILRLVNLAQTGVNWLYIRPMSAAISAGLSWILAVLEALACYFESKRERTKDIPLTTSSRYKHDEAHLVSKACFHWLTPLLRSGYSCPLEQEDLGTLPESHKGRTQFNSFNAILANFQVSNKKVGLLEFWKTCWAFMRRDFLMGGGLKLLGDLLSLVAPLGMSGFMNYISNAHKSTTAPDFATLQDLLDNGWTVAAGVLIASILQSTCSQTSTHLVNVRAIHLNGALQAKIYSKTLTIAKCANAEDEVVGRDGASPSATHLLAEDTENIMSAFFVGHYLWAIPLKLSLIMALLYQYLGVAALIASAVTILTLTPLQLFIGRNMSSNSSKLSDITDDRLQLVGSLVENMKLLKMLGWESLFCDKIRKVRCEEIKKLNQDSVLWGAMTMLTHLASIMVAVLTFGLHSWLNATPLTAATVFTALALFNQLTVPLFIFPVTIPIFIAAAVSGKRIVEFLNLGEVSETLGEPTGETRHRDEPLLTPTETLRESVTDYDSLWTPVEESMFRWPEEAEGLEAPEMDVDDVPEAENQQPSQDDVEVAESALKINNGVFLLNSSESNRVLTLGNVDIPRGKITVIVGNVGSGKSSFVSAILGELQLVQGSVTWGRNTTVAFAGQSPWLINGSIRDNIMFGRPFRPRRYGQVIEACALEPDLDILPTKDLTEVGERGINLSGGQKQRIGIARALYSRANLVILDDPLSSLDTAVGMHVFEAGIKRLVRRGRRTVLLITHQYNLLPFSHKVIVMEDCRIRIQGQLNDIETLDTNLVASWRQSAQSRGEESVSGQEKTVRERWQLVKLVASIGLERRQRSADPEEQLTETVLSRKSTRRKRTAFSEWNYLSSDLPAPLEECSAVRPAWRQNSSLRRRHTTRANSLQTRNIRTPAVSRQMSSPLVLSGMKRRSSQRLLRHIFQDSVKPQTHHPPLSLRTHQPLQRLSSNESGFSDAKSEVDPDEFEDLEVGTGGNGAEEREYGKVPRRICLLYSQACGLHLVLAYAVISLLWQAIRVATDGWLSWWTEDASTDEETLWYLWMYNGLAFMTLVLSLASHSLGQLAASRARMHLHDKLLTHVSSCAVSSVEATPAGRFINRFSTDIAVVDKKLPTSIQRLVQFVLLCGSAILVNALVTPWFLLAGLPICLLYYCVQKFYRTSSRELQRLDSISRSPVISHLVETISGVSTIRAYKYQHKFTSSFLSKLDQHTNAFLILNSSNRWLGIVLDYLGSAIVGIAMATALMTAHIAPGQVSASLAGLAINYTLLVPIYLNWVVKFSAECEMYLAAVERIDQIFKMPVEELTQKTEAKITEGWPNKGDIKFVNATLSYGPSNEPIFSNLNLHIPAGQKVGICGRSGSGKSTLILSLFRLLSTSGSLSIDGVDLKDVSPRQIRTRLAVVPQDAVLLPGSVRQNLDPAHSASDDVLWGALAAVKLKELIQQQDAGLDSALSGISLSNGQKQLFCLARAVARQAPILVMDEATSNLDKESERLVMSTAWSAFQANTILVIAHRLTTLLDCDRILVISRGRIVEDGSPSELMCRQMGMFSTMLKSSLAQDTLL